MFVALGNQHEKRIRHTVICGTSGLKYCSNGKVIRFYIFWVCVCVCSLGYPACKVQAPYCYLCPNLNIFPLYLIHGRIFEKKLLNLKCVFWYSLQLLPEEFPILRRNERDITRSVCWYSCKVNVTLVIR